MQEDMEPFLHSINHTLMEEDMVEDAASMQHGSTDASYQAILCSFYDIIGKLPPPKSSLVSSSYVSSCDLHIPLQVMDKQDVECPNGLNILTHQTLNSGASRVTLPANTNLPSSLFQEETSLVMPQGARHVVCPTSANLSVSSTTKVQGYHAGSTSKEVMDAQVSCSQEEYRALINLRSICSGRGSNAHLKLPSPYKEFSLKLAGVELSLNDLKLHDHYAALYLGQPSIPRKSENKLEQGLSVAGKRRAGAYAQEYVDLKDLIVNCAQAVAVGDASLADDILQHMRQDHGASAHGNGSQRAAHYFSEALGARIRGTGGDQFRAVVHEKPSATTILKSYKHCFNVNPMVKATHYFANQGILKAAERASRLHIVDYGFDHYGIQWAFLINALADQKGGPPLLVITGIDSPQPGNNPAVRLEESGRRLAAHARTYNVPFQFHAIASSKWEDLVSSSFHFHEDEILVVSCIMSLHLVADEHLDLVSPRQKLLTRIRSFKPHLLVIADVSAAYNSSYFVYRFREALNYYHNVFDMLDTLWGSSPDRLLKERTHYGNILNIVACEGAERVERAETYRQWQVRIERAGFEQLLIPPAILSRSRSHIKQHYHKDFFIHDDGNKWMLVGWRGRTSVAISAWKLSHVQLS